LGETLHLLGVTIVLFYKGEIQDTALRMGILLLIEGVLPKEKPGLLGFPIHPILVTTEPPPSRLHYLLPTEKSSTYSSKVQVPPFSEFEK